MSLSNIHLEVPSGIPDHGHQALLNEIRNLQAQMICAIVVNEIYVVCTLTDIVMDPFPARSIVCKGVTLVSHNSHREPFNASD